MKDQTISDLAMRHFALKVNDIPDRLSKPDWGFDPFWKVLWKWIEREKGVRKKYQV